MLRSEAPFHGHPGRKPGQTIPAFVSRTQTVLSRARTGWQGDGQTSNRLSESSSSGGSVSKPSKPIKALVFRDYQRRVPHYPLGLAGSFKFTYLANLGQKVLFQSLSIHTMLPSVFVAKLPCFETPISFHGSEFHIVALANSSKRDKRFPFLATHVAAARGWWTVGLVLKPLGLISGSNWA